MITPKKYFSFFLDEIFTRLDKSTYHIRMTKEHWLRIVDYIRTVGRYLGSNRAKEQTRV